MRGLDGSGAVAAYGGLTQRRLFVPGDPTVFEVPFHLSRTHRPPQVVSVSPKSVPGSAGLSSLVFHTSKRLDPFTMAESV